MISNSKISTMSKGSLVITLMIFTSVHTLEKYTGVFISEQLVSKFGSRANLYILGTPNN